MLKNAKKLLWHCVAASILLGSSVSAEQQLPQSMPKKIWSINRPTVEFYKKLIEKKITRNKYERIGVLIASSAVLVALGVYSFGGLVRSTDSSEKIDITKDSIRALTQETKELKHKITTVENQSGWSNYRLKRLVELLEKKAPGLIDELEAENADLKSKYMGSYPKQYGWRMWGWCKNVANVTLNNFAVLLLMGGLPGPINKMFGFWGRKLEELGKRIYHDSDFHWFVTSQTQTIQYFNDLERAAGLLPLAHDDEERDHQKQAILWNASMLTKQLARVVAFMEYQAERLKIIHTGCGIQMTASARYVYRHVSQFATDMHAFLDNQQQHAEVPAYIKKFRERLRLEEESFCTNERAALYNISDEVK